MVLLYRDSAAGYVRLVRPRRGVRGQRHGVHLALLQIKSCPYHIARGEPSGFLGIWVICVVAEWKD